MRKSSWMIVGGAVAVAALVSVTSVAFGGDFNIGIGANSNATAKDVGLPYYPGARLYKESKDEESSANVWGNFGAFGMKIVAVKLETADAPAKVVPFYNGALGKYGPVLNCSAGMPRPPLADKKSRKLDCGDDHPKPGEIVLKSGIKTDFHVVGIEPHGHGSVIALVYIQLRGTD